MSKKSPLPDTSPTSLTSPGIALPTGYAAWLADIKTRVKDQRCTYLAGCGA